MNSPFVGDQVRALAARPELAGASDSRARIDRLYSLVLSRHPSERELVLGLAFLLDEQRASPAPAPAKRRLRNGRDDACAAENAAGAAKPERPADEKEKSHAHRSAVISLGALRSNGADLERVHVCRLARPCGCCDEELLVSHRQQTHAITTRSPAARCWAAPAWALASLALAQLLGGAGLLAAQRAADTLNPLAPKPPHFPGQGQARHPPVHERRAVARRHVRPQAAARQVRRQAAADRQPAHRAQDRRGASRRRSSFSKYGQSGIEVSELFPHVGRAHRRHRASSARCTPTCPTTSRRCC